MAPVEIKLKGGLIALIDGVDAARVLPFSWCVSRTGSRKRPYVITTRRINGVKRNVYLHRFILNASSGDIIDHINGDPLDNRRENLRLCTASQNMANRAATSRSKTGVKGVRLTPSKTSWEARICVDGRQIHLGTFCSLEEAVSAHAAAEQHLQGEFAHSICHGKAA